MRTYVKPNLVSKNFPFRRGGGVCVWRGGVLKKKVAQNDVKFILVLEFLRSNNFFAVMGGGGGGGGGSMKKLTDKHSNNQPNLWTLWYVNKSLRS